MANPICSSDFNAWSALILSLYFFRRTDANGNNNVMAISVHVKHVDYSPISYSGGSIEASTYCMCTSQDIPKKRAEKSASQK